MSTLSYKKFRERYAEHTDGPFCPNIVLFSFEDEDSIKEWYLGNNFPDAEARAAAKAALKPARLQDAIIAFSYEVPKGHIIIGNYFSTQVFKYDIQMEDTACPAENKPE
jgi:hypothetical protein